MTRSPPSSTLCFVSDVCLMSRVPSQVSLDSGACDSPRIVQTDPLLESFLLAIFFSAITIVGIGKGMIGRPLSRLSRTNLRVSGECWDGEWAVSVSQRECGSSIKESQLREREAGKDMGASSRPRSGDLILSFNINLVNDARKNFGIRFGDLMGESSKTPRFRLSRLRVFFINDTGIVSSTDDEDEVNSRFRRLFLSNVDSQEPTDSAGVLGTDKLTKLNFGILVNRELLGRLEQPLLLSGLSLEDKLKILNLD